MQFDRLAEVNVVNNIGNRIGIAAIIRKVKYSQMRNGGDMVTFEMADKDAVRLCTSFTVSGTLREKLEAAGGKVFGITVDVKPYDKGEDKLSCILYDIVELTEGYSYNTFVESVENLQFYADTMGGFLNDCYDTIYGRITTALIQKYWDKISSMPAASSMHHALRGGLLQHSVSVAMTSAKIATTYNELYGGEACNVKLVICGALIHDVGKVFELSCDSNGETEYSESAAIENHTMRGILEIDRVATELGYKGFDEVAELQHIVASHHGKAEFGASITPRMTEAIIVSMADDLDAKINRFYKKLGNAEGKAQASEWTASGIEVYYRGVSSNEARLNCEITDEEQA